MQLTYKHVKPQSLVFFAFDGLPPMAKLVKQPTRRFKSVHDQQAERKIESEFREVENG